MKLRLALMVAAASTLVAITMTVAVPRLLGLPPSERTFTANELLLLPAVRLIRGCLPHLRQSPAGRVIFVTSGAVNPTLTLMAVALRNVVAFSGQGKIPAIS